MNNACLFLLFLGVGKSVSLIFQNVLKLEEPSHVEVETKMQPPKNLILFIFPHELPCPLTCLPSSPGPSNVSSLKDPSPIDKIVNRNRSAVLETVFAHTKSSMSPP